RREHRTKMPPRTEGGPIEHEHALPIERLPLSRLVEIHHEDFLDAVPREVGLRRIVGECGAGDQKKSERGRCDLHVYSDDSLCKIVTLSSKLSSVSHGRFHAPLRRMKRSLATDIALGAVAGAAATWLMDLTTTALYEREPKAIQDQENEARG